jgi:hypothetical protein
MEIKFHTLRQYRSVMRTLSAHIHWDDKVTISQRDNGTIICSNRILEVEIHTNGNMTYLTY